jgi:hypothetical protein
VCLGLHRIGSHVGQFLHDDPEAIDYFIALISGIDLGHQIFLLLDEIPPNLVGPEDGLDGRGVVGHDFLFDVQKVDAGRKKQIVGGNHLQ